MLRSELVKMAEERGSAPLKANAAKIGVVLPDGKRLWPEQDIVGGSYELPATTKGFEGSNAFVVLPVGFNQPELVDTLKPSAEELGRLVIGKVSSTPPEIKAPLKPMTEANP